MTIYPQIAHWELWVDIQARWWFKGEFTDAADAAAAGDHVGKICPSAGYVITRAGSEQSQSLWQWTQDWQPAADRFPPVEADQQ